jgi:hypothetical protein
MNVESQYLGIAASVSIWLVKWHEFYRYIFLNMSLSAAEQGL